MKFHLNTAEIYIPDSLPEEEALARTTYLCIAAHQDDIEIMAAQPILECYQQEDKWFTGVVVTDGRGSPRDGMYKKYTDEEMRLVRFREQYKAAVIGEYAAQIMLDFPSKAVKEGSNTSSTENMISILKMTRPSVVYTHNLADKHDTHVGVAMKVIAAIRNLPENERPQKLYGCEVWRNLDWMVDSDKAIFDLSEQENLQAALLGVFDSQISGGKRYDLAALARRKTNATFFASHGVDETTGLSFAMDMTPLLIDAEKSIPDFMQEFIERFSQDLLDRLSRMSE